MSRKNLALGFIILVGLTVAAIEVRNVYAHCGKCITDAKYFAGSLDKSKMTLAAASTLAEANTKGTAVHATVMRLDDGVNIEVHCLADGELVAVVIDGQTGKVLGKKPVSNLAGHASL